MASLLGSIGSALSSPIAKGVETIGSGVGTALGLVGNLQAQKQAQAAANMARANAQLTPQQLASRVNAATLPLNQNLVRAITSNVNANLAEQGLSQAPGIISSDLAMALAGPEQAQQQAAMQLVMKQLGLPLDYASIIPKPVDLSGGIAALLKSLQGFPTGTTHGGTAPTTSANFMGALLPSLNQLAPQESWTPPQVDLSQFGGMSSVDAPGSDLFAGIG